MQNWKDLYIELADKLNLNIEKLRFIDLWHNQIKTLATEHPFPTPAVFLQFQTIDTADVGLKVQDVKLQVDAYVYYETFLDTYHEGVNKSEAVRFLDLLTQVYVQLHGTDGTNYSSMRRMKFEPVDTGNAGNLYRISFECILRDYAAKKQYVDQKVKGVDVEPGKSPDIPTTKPLYRL